MQKNAGDEKRYRDKSMKKCFVHVMDEFEICRLAENVVSAAGQFLHWRKSREISDDS